MDEDFHTFDPDVFYDSLSFDIESYLGPTYYLYTRFKDGVESAIPKLPPINSIVTYITNCAIFLNQDMSNLLTTDEDMFPLVPNDLKLWVENTANYINDIGWRLVPPFIYITAQGIMVDWAAVGKIDINISPQKTSLALLGSHISNIAMGYLVLRSNGTPVNALTPILRRLLDGMNSNQPANRIQCALAMSVVASKIIFLETAKATGTNIYGNNTFQAMSITVTMAMLIEAMVNTSFLVKNLANKKLEDL